MIYQIYTCAMANDSTEYGFCFYEKEGDDDCCTEAEVIIGFVQHVRNGKRRTHAAIVRELRKGWKKYEWMAKAIVAAPEAQKWKST